MEKKENIISFGGLETQIGGTVVIGYCDISIIGIRSLNGLSSKTSEFVVEDCSVPHTLETNAVVENCPPILLRKWMKKGSDTPTATMILINTLIPSNMATVTSCSLVDAVSANSSVDRVIVVAGARLYEEGGGAGVVRDDAVYIGGPGGPQLLECCGDQGVSDMPELLSWPPTSGPAPLCKDPLLVSLTQLLGLTRKPHALLLVPAHKPRGAEGLSTVENLKKINGMAAVLCSILPFLSHFSTCQGFPQLLLKHVPDKFLGITSGEMQNYL